MRKINYKLETGYSGCEETGELEIDDTMTNSEIDTMVYEMAIEHATNWEGDDRLMSAEDWDDGGADYFYENADGSWEFV